MFLLLCWTASVSFMNKQRLLPAPGCSWNHCVSCTGSYFGKKIKKKKKKTVKQLATLCKKLNLSVSETQFRSVRISRWQKHSVLFLKLYPPFCLFSSSFGSTKQHFQHPEVKCTLWRSCMQGKAVDISPEFRSAPTHRQDKRVFYRDFHCQNWQSWYQSVPQIPLIVLAVWPYPAQAVLQPSTSSLLPLSAERSWCQPQLGVLGPSAGKDVHLERETMGFGFFLFPGFFCQ